MKENALGRHVRLALCLACLIGWWGLLFPELSLPQGSCGIVDEAGERRELTRGEREELQEKLQEGDWAEIRFRSRLLQMISEYWKR